MKTLKYTGILSVFIGGSQLLAGCSGYVVATGPPPMVNEVIVVAPSPCHVWMPGYYSYNRGNYVYNNGYYRVPPHGRSSYTQGNWHNTPKGYKRDKGHWN